MRKTLTTTAAGALLLCLTGCYVAPAPVPPPGYAPPPAAYYGAPAYGAPAYYAAPAPGYYAPYPAFGLGIGFGGGWHHH